MNIQKGKFYVAIKDSNDGTFRVGDYLWIEATDIDECIRGSLGIEVEKGWIKRHKMELLSQLAELEKNEVSSIDEA